MTAPVPAVDETRAVLGFAAALAVARARRGLLTVQEIRDALDEAFAMGQRSVLAVVDHEVQLGAAPHQIARRAAAAAGEER